jgi:hypothetical protein
VRVRRGVTPRLASASAYRPTALLDGIHTGVELRTELSLAGGFGLTTKSTYYRFFPHGGLR